MISTRRSSTQAGLALEQRYSRHVNRRTRPPGRAELLRGRLSSPGVPETLHARHESCERFVVYRRRRAWHARSPARSSASTRAGSKSKRTCQWGQSGLRDRRTRRPCMPGGQGAGAQRHLLGRAQVADGPDHRQPRACVPAQGGSAFDLANRPGRARCVLRQLPAGALAGHASSASSPSTGGFGPLWALSSPPRARAAPASTG